MPASRLNLINPVSLNDRSLPKAVQNQDRKVDKGTRLGPMITEIAACSPPGLSRTSPCSFTVIRLEICASERIRSRGFQKANL